MFKPTIVSSGRTYNRVIDTIKPYKFGQKLTESHSNISSSIESCKDVFEIEDEQTMTSKFKKILERLDRQLETIEDEDQKDYLILVTLRDPDDLEAEQRIQQLKQRGVK